MTIPILCLPSLHYEFPLPGLKKRLSYGDFVIDPERKEACRLLLKFFDRSREYDIEPEFYQMYGIAIASEDSLACNKAQILAINGCFGKYNLSRLSDLDLSIDFEELRNRIRDLFLLRSIRWYISSGLNLIEWATPKALEPFRQIEAIGHECVSAAYEEKGYFEIVQFYLAILPFSKDTTLREKISKIEPLLDYNLKAFLREQLFALDAIKRCEEPVFEHPSREVFYQDRLASIKAILKDVNEYDLVCEHYCEDFKLKIKTTALILFCEARKMGVGVGPNIEHTAITLLKEAVSSPKPNALHVKAVKIAIRAFTLLANFDKIADAKQKLYTLINRIKS